VDLLHEPTGAGGSSDGGQSGIVAARGPREKGRDIEMNVRRVLEYVAGLVLLLLVGGAGTFGVELTTPASGEALFTPASTWGLVLSAVGIVLAGFLLRTWWALFIAPVVYVGTGLAYGMLRRV
jgi:hypothetical protein